MIRTLVILVIAFSAQGFADTTKTTKQKVTTTTTATQPTATSALAQDLACVAAPGETAYKVEGMTCGDCEKSVSKQLGGHPVVAKATANHKTGCLNIVWKAGKSLTEAQVAEQVKKAGFGLAKAPAAHDETHSH